MDKSQPAATKSRSWNLSRQASKILSTQFCHRHQLLHHSTRSDLSARVWKKLSGETKGRMAGLLSRVETESCKCCKCCKFRPDLNLSAKIWSLYWKPTTALSSWSFHQSFSIDTVSWSNLDINLLDPWLFEQRLLYLHFVFAKCNLLSKNVSLWFCYHQMHDWFDCAFSRDLGFIFLRQKLDNWIYTT